MSEILVSAYYQQSRREILKEISALSAEELEGTEAAGWVVLSIYLANLA